MQPSFSLLRGHSAFLNTVSGAVMTTRVLSATDPVRNALPPTTEWLADHRLAAQNGGAGVDSHIVAHCGVPLSRQAGMARRGDSAPRVTP